MRAQRSSRGMEALMQRLDELDDKKLQVGWFESAKYDDATPVAGIMAQNEFGNPARSIPARPFMRPAVESNSTKWSDTARKGFAAVVQGKRSPDSVLNVIGLQAVGDIKNVIEGGNFAPLSPITIALRLHRDNGQRIGGAFVGSVASAINNGETGRGELGDQSYPNKTPLQDTGIAISTLTYEVT